MKMICIATLLVVTGATAVGDDDTLTSDEERLVEVMREESERLIAKLEAKSRGRSRAERVKNGREIRKIKSNPYRVPKLELEVRSIGTFAGGRMHVRQVLDSSSMLVTHITYTSGGGFKSLRPNRSSFRIPRYFKVTGWVTDGIPDDYILDVTDVIFQVVDTDSYVTVLGDRKTVTVLARYPVQDIDALIAKALKAKRQKRLLERNER